jgi:hypothetical protein
MTTYFYVFWALDILKLDNLGLEGGVYYTMLVFTQVGVDIRIGIKSPRGIMSGIKVVIKTSNTQLGYIIVIIKSHITRYYT